MTDSFFYLTDIPIFKSLTDEDTELILKNSVRKKFPANCVIHLEGQPAGFFALLTHGKAQTLLLCEDGREILLNFYKPGDFFGEMNIAEAGVWPYSVRTLSPTQMIFISLEIIKQLTQKNGGFAISFVAHLSAKLNRAQNRLRDTIFERGEGKIIKYFAHIASEIGVPEEEGIFIPEKLSHQVIADSCGLARETVSRLLRNLQLNGLLIRKKNGWQISGTGLFPAEDPATD